MAKIKYLKVNGSDREISAIVDETFSRTTVVDVDKLRSEMRKRCDREAEICQMNEDKLRPPRMNDPEIATVYYPIGRGTITATNFYYKRKVRR